MSTRKLEHDIDHMQRKAAAHFTELARKSETIAQLKETLDTRDTLIAQLQAQNAHGMASSAAPAIDGQRIAGAARSTTPPRPRRCATPMRASPR